MCSGCPGNYEGDYDEQSDAREGFVDDAALREEPADSRGRRRPMPYAQPGWSTRPEGNAPSDTEDYEVWVSGDHIVERRTIVFDPAARGQMAEPFLAAMELKGRSAEGAATQHSRSASANTYQPLSGPCTRGTARAADLRIQFLIYFLAASAGLCLTIWLALELLVLGAKS